MKLLFLIGNGAVGKMIVGQELMKITELRLFHNHMSIEPVLEIFGHFNSKAIARIREVIFEEYATSDNYGLIFTFMWDFAAKSEWDYVEKVSKFFKDKGAEVYYAELVTTLEERIKRNTTENRLKHKASKQDIEASNQRLLHAHENHRCESFDNEVKFNNYLKIDNTNLSAEKVALIIKEQFEL